MFSNSSSSSLPYGSDATAPAVKPLRINKQQYLKEFQGITSSKFRSKGMEKRVEDITKKLSPNLAKESNESRNALSSYSPKKLEPEFKNLANSPSTNHSRNFWNNLSNQQQQTSNTSPALSQSSIYSPYMFSSNTHEEASEHQFNDSRGYQSPKKSSLTEQNIDEIPYNHAQRTYQQSGYQSFPRKPNTQLEREQQNQRSIIQGRVVLENLEKPSSCNSYITNNFTITRAGSINRLHGPRKMLGPEIKTSLLMKDTITEGNNEVDYSNGLVDNNAADSAAKQANLGFMMEITSNGLDTNPAPQKTMSHSFSENDFASKKTLTHSKSKSCLMKHSVSSSPIKKAGEKKKNVSFVQGSPLVMEYECLTPEVDLSSGFDPSNHHTYQLPASNLNIHESYGFIQSYPVAADLRNSDSSDPLDYSSSYTANNRPLPNIPQLQLEALHRQNVAASNETKNTARKTISKKVSIEDRINHVYESLSLGDDENDYRTLKSDTSSRENFTRPNNERSIRKSMSRESLIDKDVYIKEALLDSVINKDTGYDEDTFSSSTDLHRQNSIQLEPESYQKLPENGHHDNTIENNENFPFVEDVVESQQAVNEDGEELGFEACNEEQAFNNDDLSSADQDNSLSQVVQPLTHSEHIPISDDSMVASTSGVVLKLENIGELNTEIDSGVSDSHQVQGSSDAEQDHHDESESMPIKVKAEYVDNYYRSNNYVVPSLSDTNIDYHLNASSTSYVKNEALSTRQGEENSYPYETRVGKENEDITLYANQLVYEQIGRLKAKSMENLRVHPSASDNNRTAVGGALVNSVEYLNTFNQTAPTPAAPEISLTEQIQAKIKSEQAVRDLQLCSTSGTGLGLGLVISEQPVPDVTNVAVKSRVAVVKQENNDLDFDFNDNTNLSSDIPVKPELVYNQQVPLHSVAQENIQPPSQPVREILPSVEAACAPVSKLSSTHTPESISDHVPELISGPIAESTGESAPGLTSEPINESVSGPLEGALEEHVEESLPAQEENVEFSVEGTRLLSNTSPEYGSTNGRLVSNLTQSSSLRIDLDNFDDSDDFVSEFNDMFQGSSNVEQEPSSDDFVDTAYPHHEHEIFQRLNDINIDAKDATISVQNAELKIKPSATLANLSLIAQPFSDIIYGNPDAGLPDTSSDKTRDIYADMPSTPVMKALRPESSYLQLSFDNIGDDNGSIFGDLEDEFEKISPTKKNSYFDADNGYESEVSMDSPTKKSRYVVRESNDFIVAIGDKDGRFYNGKHRTVASPTKKWQDIVNLDQKIIPPIPQFSLDSLAPKKQLGYESLLMDTIPTGIKTNPKELTPISLFPLPSSTDVTKPASNLNKSQAPTPSDIQSKDQNIIPVSSVHKAVQLPTEESGRLFVRVVGIKDLNLPFLDNMTNPEQAKFSLTLDNGIHCISTPYKNLSKNCSIDQEFELTVENDLEFIFTLKAIRPENTKLPPVVTPLAPSHAAIQRQPVKEKRSTFSKLFSSPKKKQSIAKSISAPTPIRKVESSNAWESYVATDGSFARSYISLSQYKKDIYGKVSNFNVYCFNEWAKDKKISSIPHARLPPYKVGKLELQMMFIPRASKKEELPKSIKSAVDELHQASLLKPVCFEGTLTQNGGDCKYWRRRFFTLDGPTLTAFSESTKSPRASINLSKAERVISDKDTLAVPGVDNAKNAFGESEEAFNFIDEGFRIKFTNGETLDFYADTKAHKYEWVQALTQVIGTSPVRKPWVDLVLAHKKSAQ